MSKTEGKVYDVRLVQMFPALCQIVNAFWAVLALEVFAFTKGTEAARPASRLLYLPVEKRDDISS
jgi:hypothetical protein